MTTKIMRSRTRKMIGLRVAVPVLVSVCLFLVVIFMVFLPMARTSLMEQKRKEIRNLTEASLGILSHYHKFETEGLLTPEEAMDLAVDAISEIRFGPENKDYFWINDYHPKMIMHPYRTDLDGEDISGFSDSRGKKLFTEFVLQTEASGEAYVDYYWQWKDDPARIVPKLSFVKRFEPWGWIIGTGVYLDDVEDEVAGQWKEVMQATTFILGILSLLAGVAIWQGRVGDLKLRRSEEKIRAVFDDSFQFMSILTTDGVVVEINETALKRYGYKEEDVAGTAIWDTPWWKSVPELHDKLHQSVKDASSGEVARFEAELRTSSGDRINIDFSLKPACDFNGNVFALIAESRDITERRTAEEDLLRSHERFKAVMDSLDALVLVSDVDTREVLFINKFGRRMMKCTEGDKCLIESCLGSCSSNVKKVQDDIHAASPERPVKGLVWEYHDPERNRWYESRVQMIRWTDGRVVRMEIATDITDRKKFEDKLRESERIMSTLMSNLPGIAYRCKDDEDWTMIFISEGCYDLTGYQPSDLYGNVNQAYAAIIHPDDREVIAAIVDEAVGKNEPFEIFYRIITAEGDEKWVWEKGRAVYSEDGQDHFLEGFISDVTEMKQVEEEKRLNASRLWLSLELIEKRDTSFKEFSEYSVEAALELTGSKYGFWAEVVQEKDEIILMGFSRSVMKQCEVMGVPEKLKISRSGRWAKPVSSGVFEIFNDGNVFTDDSGIPTGHVPITKYLVVPVHDGDRVIALMGVANKEKDYNNSDARRLGLFARSVWDMLQRRQAKEERERLIDELEYKNEELERFTYTVSHDLKSPIITIKGFLGLLEKDLADGDMNQVQTDMERIGVAASRMEQLLKELLELSRIGRVDNPHEEVNLKELMDEVVEIVHGRMSEKKVDLRISPKLPVVVGDRIRLSEVFQNLLENAVKFVDESRPSYIEVGVDEQDGEYVFYVRDNGIGIDNNYLDKVFGLFEQLDQKREGTGIGLALVKRIVETHGGRVWATSEGLGKGASFHFTLPEVHAESS